MTAAIGHRIWVIPEGFIPAKSMEGADRATLSHEAACILNPGPSDAHLRITLYFVDRPPAGPYEVTVAAERTLHLRFNELTELEPVPLDTDYASIIESDVPIFVQHTRLDSRHPNIALLSTMAIPAD